MSLTRFDDFYGITYLRDDAVTAMHKGQAPRHYSATGYGSKLPTPYTLTLSDKRTRRVYVMNYGNAGSAYVIVAGKVAFLDTDTEHALETI